jgi:hypothetical protein
MCSEMPMVSLMRAPTKTLSFVAPSLAVILLATIAADNYVSLQSEMDTVLSGDPRNSGIEVSVRFGHYVERSVLVYDLKSLGPTNSIADVFRVLLQFAHAMDARNFTSIELAFRGQTRFLLTGQYFKRIGGEYGSQNPVYTMRTFSENVLKPDGSTAYPTWTGGLIGVVGKEMEQFNDFHKEWYLSDLAALPR